MAGPLINVCQNNHILRGKKKNKKPYKDYRENNRLKFFKLSMPEKISQLKKMQFR